MFKCCTVWNRTLREMLCKQRTSKRAVCVYKRRTNT